MSLSKLRGSVMDREAWCGPVQGIAKDQTWLSDWTELNIPLGFPGGSDGKDSAMWETRVQSLGWEDHLEKGIPTPVFLLGEFHGQRSLVSYSPWGCKELYTTEGLSMLAIKLYRRDCLKGTVKQKVTMLLTKLPQALLLENMDLLPIFREINYSLLQA